MTQTDIDAQVADATLKLQSHFGTRVTSDYLRKRSQREIRRDYWFKYSNTRVKKMFSVRVLLRIALHLIGMRRRGQRNALNLSLENNLVIASDANPDNPAPGNASNLSTQYTASSTSPEIESETQAQTKKEEFHLLQLSDLHIDANPDYATVLAQTIDGVKADITLISGDFKARSFGSNEKTLAIMEQLAPSIPNIGQHCYAILGNHDNLRLVPQLERMGIRCLINESVVVDLPQTKLWLSGIDDPSYYAFDDLPLSVENNAHFDHWLKNTNEYFSVLMAHSPHVIDAALKYPFDLYLAGHLHGGQICWPSGKPVHVKDTLPWEVCCGVWRKGRLQGYTSRGSGTSIIDARFNCRPEVTLHTIRPTTTPAGSARVTPA